MDRQAVLAAFDEQIRRHPVPDAPNGHVEHDDNVIRSMSVGAGWTGVTWSDLDQVSADTVIAAQVSRFAELSRPWEWKHYSYDQPARATLASARGFRYLQVDASPGSRPTLERLGFVELATTTHSPIQVEQADVSVAAGR